MMDAIQVLAWTITLWIVIGGTIGLTLFLNDWFNIFSRIHLWWIYRKR